MLPKAARGQIEKYRGLCTLSIPRELRVWEDCPYYKKGHIIAKFTADGVIGPWNELYSRKGKGLLFNTSSHPVLQL